VGFCGGCVWWDTSLWSLKGKVEKGDCGYGYENQ